MLNPAGQTPGADKVTSFLSSLHELRGIAYRATSAREAVEALRGIVDALEPKSIVVAGLPLSVKMLAESALKGRNYKFVDQIKPGDALQVISKADVGITWAQYGIVEQGAIMEVSYDDTIKLTSSLPRVHIALLSSRDLLPDLASAMGEVGKILSAGDKKPTITLVSGPSRTADIEMTLLYGVHGPSELHVIVLEWL